MILQPRISCSNRIDKEKARGVWRVQDSFLNYIASQRRGRTSFVAFTWLLPSYLPQGLPCPSPPFNLPNLRCMSQDSATDSSRKLPWLGLALSMPILGTVRTCSPSLYPQCTNQHLTLKLDVMAVCDCQSDSNKNELQPRNGG